jgi:hypothetical protein
MAHEASQAGLQLRENLDQARFGQTSESLTGLWKVLEYLPIKRLSYTTPTGETFW